MPVTISGVTSERYSEPDSHFEPRRHKPYAHSVPITVDTTIETTAMTRLFHDEAASWGSRTIALYQSSEKPVHSEYRDWLKLNTPRINMGTCRNAYANTAYTPSHGPGLTATPRSSAPERRAARPSPPPSAPATLP